MNQETQRGERAEASGNLPEATWQSPETRKRLLAFLDKVAQKCDLPTPPKVADRAIQLTRDPRVRTAEVARVIASDTALAAQVLRISGSATYLGRRDPPRTLEDAITTVGFQIVRRILIVAASRSVYLVGDRVGEVLWEHALATALAADEIGQVTGESRGGMGFIAGLLHDVGKLVFHLADAAAFTCLPFFDEQGEKNLFGVTHAEAGSYLTETWGIEPAVAKAISEHHVRPVCLGLAGTVATADWIAHQIGFGSVQAEIGPLETIDEPVDLVAVVERVAKAFEAERAFFN